jgi:hypothetical protein
VDDTSVHLHLVRRRGTADGVRHSGTGQGGSGGWESWRWEKTWLGHFGPKGQELGPARGKFMGKDFVLLKRFGADLTKGYGKIFSQFWNKDLGFKIPRFKYFQTKFELEPN